MTRENLKGLEKIGATMSCLGTPAEGEYKDYYFEVDENYEVTIIGKLKGEKPSVQAQVITTGIVEQGGKLKKIVIFTSHSTSPVITSKIFNINIIPRKIIKKEIN